MLYTVGEGNCVENNVTKIQNTNSWKLWLYLQDRNSNWFITGK